MANSFLTPEEAGERILNCFKDTIRQEIPDEPGQKAGELSSKQQELLGKLFGAVIDQVNSNILEEG